MNRKAENGVSGGCMNTISGILLDPADVKPEDIDLYDIAHPLSMICRGVGQVKFFFSVGQHCINCALEAEARGYSDRVVLGALLHDASEAYVSDVIRPVKVYLEGYKEVEFKFQHAIFTHFGLGDFTAEEKAQVDGIDNDMLWQEAKVLFSKEEDMIPPEMSRKPDISERSFADVEKEYTDMALTLLKRLEKAEERPEIPD